MRNREKGTVHRITKRIRYGLAPLPFGNCSFRSQRCICLERYTKLRITNLQIGVDDEYASKNNEPLD
jgi:hypothetical protein